MTALAIASRTEPTPAALEEARRTLNDAAHRRFGAIPAAALVEHVLRSTDGSDFAVREAALEALARRWGFAQRDGLVIVERPPSGRVFGRYTTGRKVARRHEARPYTTVLEKMAPLISSCDCPDFLRSSLAVCKHVLVVLDDICRSRRRFALAMRENAEAPARAPRLVWRPELALTGELDRLAGLRLEMPNHNLPLASARSAGAGHMTRARRALARGEIDAAVRRDLGRRRDLLSSLRVLVAGETRERLEATPAARALATLFDAIRVLRTDDGGIRIDAPPEAAGSLVALFEGMARLLAVPSSSPVS